MAFNMALSWKCPQNVPTFHVSLYFFHLLFSKKHLVVIVFFMFCPVSVLVGWLWQLLFIRRVPDISHTPRIFSYVEISHTLSPHVSSGTGSSCLLWNWLLMSPLAALSPMIWREHWGLYCCEKLTDCREATEGLAEMWILRVRADWLS